MIVESVIDVLVNQGSEAGVGGEAVREAVVRVLAAGGVRRAEVSVTFLADQAMRELNKSYLGHDWPTDVLSFALGSGPHPSDGPGDDPSLAGDIYIGAERLVEQAAERGIPAQEEGIRLAVHGALHLLGRNHPEGPEREESEFFADQEAWVARLLAVESDE